MEYLVGVWLRFNSAAFLSATRLSSQSVVILCAIWLASCANVVTNDEFEVSGREGQSSTSPSGFGKLFFTGGLSNDEVAKGRDFERRGKNQLSSRSKPNTYEFDERDRVNLNLKDATVEAATKAIVGDILGLSYVVSPKVAGKVTLQTTNAISTSALLDTYNAILAFNGARLVTRDGVAYIEPAGGRGTLPVKFQSKWEKSGRDIGQSIKIVPLDYVSAAEMSKLLKPLIGEDKIVYVDVRQNLIFIAGSPRELRAALDAINLFDVDAMEGKSFQLTSVKNADAEVIAKELEQVFSTQEGEALSGLVKFVPNNRLASILAISSRPHYLNKAREWIERLDRAAAGANQRLFVYPVQNREAEDLAALLQNILDGGQPKEDQPSKEHNSNQLTNRIDTSFEAAAETAGVSPSKNRTRNASFTSGRLRVVSDSANNAILIYATQSEYETVLPMIKRLDSLPNQVLLEATIAEVTLTDELKFGLRWYLESGNFAVKFTDALSGAAGGVSPGFSFLFSAGESQIALNALSSITDVNIISSPNLMVLDNRKAVLQIGDQVPIAKESAASVGDQTVVNAIELKDTGIILTVTPRVNDSGRVILDISQEVSDVVKTTTSGIDSPTIRQRKVTTTVVVNDGDSLALGGLIQQREDVTKAQVPVLGDVPIVGNLFKHKEDTEKRTELLILITPHVIRDLREANNVTDEFRKQLGGLRVLGEKPERGFKHQVNRILN